MATGVIGGSGCLMVSVRGCVGVIAASAGCCACVSE